MPQSGSVCCTNGLVSEKHQTRARHGLCDRNMGKMSLKLNLKDVIACQGICEECVSSCNQVRGISLNASLQIF